MTVFRFVILVTLAISLLAKSEIAHAQARAECTVVRVEGEATASAGGPRRQAVTQGLGLGIDTTVRTAAQARVTLACANDLQVIVGPESEVAIARIVGGGSRPFALRLVDGIAGFLFGGRSGEVQVHTPSMVAAVRSTEWAMRVEDRASAVFAREGRVFVIAGDASARLHAGDGVDVSAEGAIGPVVRWGRGRIARFDALLGPDW